MRRNTLSGLRFSLVTYYLYALVGKAAPFASCSHLRRFTNGVYTSQYKGKTYEAQQTAFIPTSQEV